VSPTSRLVFTEGALAKMQAFAQRHWSQPEAGGVLLGRFLLDSTDIAVDDVTAPQPKDRRTRFSFFRSKQHNLVARAKWQESRSTAAYLGLWHTHPEPDPNPSGVDRQDWERAVALDTFEGNRLFFPIVGTHRIRVWTKTRTGPIKELRLEGQ
jgi:integrative and conjugative element protein (TIGR02256 family)